MSSSELKQRKSPPTNPVKGSVASATAFRDFRAFGLPLGHYPEYAQAAFLSGGSLFCGCVFALLQEKVFTIPGFRYGGFMSFLTAVTFMLCAQFERMLKGDTTRKGSLLSYVGLSFLTMGGMWLTNKSLDYINYPLRIIFKSSKIVPTMLITVIYVGRRYSVAQYMNVMVLAASIVVFTMADVKTDNGLEGSPLGVLLICAAVTCDALTSNFQEKFFFGKKRCSEAEMMFFASGFGALGSLIPLYMTGELFEAAAHAQEHPEVLSYICTFGILGYLSVAFVLLNIRRFGATNTEIVKSARKILSIMISFVWFGKPWNYQHVLGFALFTSTVAYGVHQKRMRSHKMTRIASKLSN